MSDEASKTKGLMWLAVGIVLAALVAFGVSPLIRAVPWTWEQKLAGYVRQDMTAKACLAKPKTEAALNKLVGRLYPLDASDVAMPVKVQITNAHEVNAYAQLGGLITINSGLLEEAQSPEEVAGVLAHEVEHVHRRHILEGALMRLMTREGLDMLATGGLSSGDWGDYFLSMGFTRTQEAEADEGGLRRLQTAHIDNHGFQNFFERMKKETTTPEFLSDHPSSQSRFEKVKDFPNKDTKPVMSRSEWLILQGYCR